MDTADTNPNYIPENLSINDQESIIEFFIEKVLDFGDVIKEFDDVDTDEQQSSYSSTFKFIIYVVALHRTKLIHASQVKLYFAVVNYDVDQGFLQVYDPPPEC